VKSTGIEGPSVWARRLSSFFVCFVTLIFTEAASEPTETMVPVSKAVVLESTGVGGER